MWTRIRLAIQWRLDYVRYSAGRRWRRLTRPLIRLDEPDIARALTALSPASAGTLFVHSSLSACGQITHGAATVVGALRGWVGGGTLVLPTHTYCYPKQDGTVPVYDPATTASMVGAISDWFWRQPGVSRSVHPSHSLAAVGPRQAELTSGHELCDTPCGERTPYERLVSSGCAVLMFGARLDAYTLFHTAEDMAKVPYLYESKPYDLKVIRPPGEVFGVRMWRQDMSVPRRFEEMDAWLEARGLLTRRRLGRGWLLYVPDSREAHEAVVSALRVDPLLLVAKPHRSAVARRFGLEP